MQKNKAQPNAPAIKEMVEEGIEVKRKMLQSLVFDIERACDMIENALRSGKKVILAGNGGSCSQASHIAAEFIGRYKLERKSLPAIALSSEMSAITAIGNDYGYEQVFSRQLEGLGNEGDVLIALSTSGNSQNLARALEMAQRKKIKTISLLGKDGGNMKGSSDVEIVIPSHNTPRIQECHLMILHMACEIVERRMFP